MILPVPVSRNRLLDPLCVFIFGMSPCLRSFVRRARPCGVPSGTAFLAGQQRYLARCDRPRAQPSPRHGSWPYLSASRAGLEPPERPTSAATGRGPGTGASPVRRGGAGFAEAADLAAVVPRGAVGRGADAGVPRGAVGRGAAGRADGVGAPDRKSTRLNSSHVEISYA